MPRHGSLELFVGQNLQLNNINRTYGKKSTQKDSDKSSEVNRYAPVQININSPGGIMIPPRRIKGGRYNENYERENPNASL